MIARLLFIAICASALPINISNNLNNTFSYNFTKDWELYQESMYNDTDLKYMEYIAQNCSQHMFVVAGGTNAANNGDKFKYNLTGQVLMWSMNPPRWINASFPLEGADGSGSAPWLIFADKLANETKSPVCLIDIAQTASHIMEWTPGGIYGPLLSYALSIVSKYGIENKNVMFQQGEADSNYYYYTDNYASYLYNIIFSSGQHTNWYISQTSYSPTNQRKYENLVRKAQQMVVNSTDMNMKVYAGPNTDALCTEYRTNNFYFNKLGIMTLSDAWFQAYIQQNNTFVLGDGHCNERYITASELFCAFLFMTGLFALGMLCCLSCAYGARNYGYDKKLYVVYYKFKNRSYSSISDDEYVEQKPFATESKPPPYSASA